MELAELAGWLATGASTLSFSPKAWKIIKTRQTADMSTDMSLLAVAGFSLWAVYGLMLGVWLLVATNTICFSL